MPDGFLNDEILPGMNNSFSCGIFFPYLMRERAEYCFQEGAFTVVSSMYCCFIPRKIAGDLIF